MNNLFKTTSFCFFLLMAISTTYAQTWNGVGVHVLTYREGPVAIGTASIPGSNQVGFQDISNYKLFVCGGILADEWLVPNSTWCDYVFQPNYYLMPLEAVAQHIQEKGHLHNTPSAVEIEENGLKMKEMTINQQEKIEEIYLHLINLNERLKTVETANELLRTENEQLRKAIEALTQQDNHK